ncbi:MAG: transforming growth factor-beta-induced protein [Kiritimatiellia bacterium]|jgi:transforming growth factor-beta-induced protein
MKATHILTVYFASLIATVAIAEDKNIVDVAVSNPQFSTLVTALKAADLVDVVKDGTFTVFAPTNEAFEKLPAKTLKNLLKPENKKQLAAVLTFHVIPGTGYTLSDLLARKEVGTVEGGKLSVRFEQGRVQVNDAVLQTSDIVCANGTIHVIDSVLIPAAKAPATIVETAASLGSFKTLLAAAEAAGLMEVLSGKGPFTVFAPTDEAFAKVPEKVLADLLKPANKEKLVNLLTYHVVSGEIRAGDALNAGSATALNGGDIPISYKDGGMVAQWAKVLQVDVAGGNGIIHVIDSVMMPPAKKSVSTAEQHIQVIAQAVEKGVPMFNEGDTQGCAKVYMQASKTLLDACGLPEHAQTSLRHAVTRASQTSCSNTQAWSLRHGLDRAYVALKHAMQNDVTAN